MFHDGHRKLQVRFDGRQIADAFEQRFRLSELDSGEKKFIENSEFFLATAHDGSVDCSYKGGVLGFVQVPESASLEWTDYDGNSMYRSLGNIIGKPRVGLLFMRFGERPVRLRVNGVCELLDGASAGDKKITVRLHTEEMSANCPRYIPDLSRPSGSM
ncbi:pyridoxamine 5'-phosphate oxidase family protein [Marimonas arenosa]|uniref:Pyridoxamine 5'-phosphate oxidase family protein n=1 Tax=Marimonas arenosa TaxID=1795305 RepID=A0AAE3WCD4_9RHOB|nr:pyridoxamine 5'-phosphate oxidase family protein [Marimonas arenosa]MDQ2089850.1 pyridoxamine 5'-phosphate oxidase family protein [Marimonas arenosa]